MRIILFTGRGGSGVSTIAAATAATLARSGRRTLAFGLGSGLGDALGVPLMHEPREIAPNLLALETRHGDDEPDEYRDWLEDLLEWRGVEPVTELIGLVIAMSRLERQQVGRNFARLVHQR